MSQELDRFLFDSQLERRGIPQIVSQFAFIQACASFSWVPMGLLDGPVSQTWSILTITCLFGWQLGSSFGAVQNNIDFWPMPEGTLHRITINHFAKVSIKLTSTVSNDKHYVTHSIPKTFPVWFNLLQQASKMKVHVLQKKERLSRNHRTLGGAMKFGLQLRRGRTMPQLAVPSITMNLTNAFDSLSSCSRFSGNKQVRTSGTF